MIERHNPGPASTLAPAEPGAALLPSRDGASLWSRLIGAASPDRQRELLALARRQGLVYSNQVPANGHGGAADRGRHLLASLLEPGGLEPVRGQPIEPIDGALDDVQRDAVAQALGTPDVCLIQGLPGTGKSRTTVELIHQAAKQGQRILLAGLAPAALDDTLEAVSRLDCVFAIRCLDSGEKAETLPTAIQALTMDRRLSGLRGEGLNQLRRQANDLEASVGRIQEQHGSLERCLAILEEQHRLRHQAAEVRRQHECVADEVKQLALTGQVLSEPLRPIEEARKQSQSEYEKSLAHLRQRLGESRQVLARLEAERQPLQALADARQSGRWWSVAWWRASLASAALTRLESITRDCEQQQAEVTRLAAEEQRLLQSQQDAAARYQAEWQAIYDAAVASRQAGLKAALAELESQQQQLHEEWQALCCRLDQPPQATAEAVRQALDNLQDQLLPRNECAGLTREWLACLEQRADTLADWLHSAANLAAVPLGVLGSDPFFGENVRPGTTFDLAIVEEAQRLTEADFVRLARRARRLVLVADTEQEPAACVAGMPTLFQRLWQKLHCDPRQLPYVWRLEKGRLCCQMRHCPPEQRRHLESERVADFPDIELRILTPPRSAPALVELVFPPSMPIDQAKLYIYRELQELPVQAHGRGFRWQDDEDRLILRLSDQTAASPLPVTLERGIREMVAGQDAGPALTCCIEFDKQAGWNRVRAEEWIGKHLSIRDLGRTIRLDRPYRMEPELAAVVADILFAGGYRTTGAGQRNGNGAAVQFVAVPAAPPTERPASGRKLAANGRGKLARQGAGLELDLADPRQRSRLPAEVRDHLPAHGMVNLFEAQAVVRKLEALARPSVGNGCGIGVLALYPSQAALIRILVRQSAQLQGMDIAIGTPDTFRQKESGVLLVSLTRSHVNRAVPYGDGAATLAVALTRARHQLILFGDPGTLARRGQWERAVDHLDEPTAAREREVVTRLCEYLQGRGAHARAFHLDEGSGP